jgi:hypothetical protein
LLEIDKEIIDSKKRIMLKKLIINNNYRWNKKKIICWMAYFY